MKKEKLLLVAVIITLLSLALVGCNGKAKEDVSQRIRPVKYQQVTKKNITPSYSYSGSLEAEVNSNLAFRVPGKINKFLVEVGAKVEEGQVLAKLDQSDYKLQVKSMKANVKQAQTGVSRALSKVSQAQAAVVSAKAQYNDAISTYHRIRKLYQNDNVSKADYDRSKAAKESAAAQLDQAKAKLKEAKDGVEAAKAKVDSYQQQLQLAQRKLGYTTLKAHMAGEIVNKYQESGEVVGAGRPVLTLDSNHGFEVQVFVDEDFISQITAGDSVVINVEAINQKQIKGKVEQIGRTAARGYQGNYPVTVKLIEQVKKLKAGMTATVKFSADSNQEKIVVSTQSVTADQQGNFVYTVQKTEDGYGQIKKVRVEAGEITDQGIEIISGLDGDELVVTKGINQIVDGQKVKLSN